MENSGILRIIARRKMATDDDIEHRPQGVPLCRVKHYWRPNTSLIVLAPLKNSIFFD
jgi:hypothetical protein